MLAITDSQTMQTISLDRALEYAVIQSWDELMPDRTAGLIHIEYQTGSDGVVEYLKVWSSIARGTWKLVCELWMRPLWSHVTGLRFENNYRSETLSNSLELIMGKKQTFPRVSEQAGLIQIHPPTQAERSEADRWMDLSFGHSDRVEAHVAACIPASRTR
jgi:hypothetical protein